MSLVMRAKLKKLRILRDLKNYFIELRNSGVKENELGYQEYILLKDYLNSVPGGVLKLDNEYNCFECKENKWKKNLCNLMAKISREYDNNEIKVYITDLHSSLITIYNY